MFKVLLVDDEQIERESISKLIDWGANQIDFIGAAKNGFEAYDMIVEKNPDIVITDIKMPVISGLELIEKVKKDYPEISFIVLSGYGDFEYTSKAMSLEMRHYLLKPVTEKKILDTLVEVEKERVNKAAERAFVSNLEGNLEKVLPHVKQQFLRDSALTGIYDEKSSDYFKTLFGIVEDRFRLVLFSTESKCDFVDKFALRNIAEEILGTAYLSTVIESNVLILVGGNALRVLVDRILEVQKMYMSYFNIKLAVSVSDMEGFCRIHKMYEQTVAMINRRFELQENSVLTPGMLQTADSRDSFSMSADMELICSYVKNEKVDELNYSLNIFFAKLNNEKLPKVKACCKTLLQAIMNFGDTELQGQFGQKAEEIDALGEPGKIYELVRSVTNEIVDCKIINPAVDATMKCIYENISNPQLSLGWVAKNVLYMNEDYLGRLFYKEVNDRFSHFVSKTRIEMAKRLIESTDNLKLHEISRLTGFSENSQYFSKTFKSFTGCTPSEYKIKFNKTGVRRN